ncbi:hypothetical protein ACO0LG_17555 [Undibacterium sp. Ji42W]|uniref:hypothetical protein n=1 Tax=Undibacterium sp. Ji42W TaxID=3413039 RepID=UPI003BF3D19C
MSDAKINNAMTIDPTLPDMQLALQGLQNSLHAMQTEISRQTIALDQLQAGRRQLLEGQVARLLPDFSGATLDALVLACPGFVDDMVRASFSENRKILGLFTRPGAAAALTTLKIRLAFFLDTQKAEDLRNIDFQIANAAEEKLKLEKLRYETQAGIRMLEKYQASGQAVPAEVQVYIRQLAERARQIAAKQVGGPVDNTTTDYDNSNYTSYDNSIAFPWLYFSQDINHNVDYEPASNPHKHTKDVHQLLAPLQPVSQIESAAPANCVVDTSVTQDGTAPLSCLTDDRLGAYS